MKMRTFSFLFLLGLALSVHSQSTVYLSENFKNGIPDNFVLKDYYNNPVVLTDFKDERVNDTWSAYSVDSEDIQAAICTSRGEKDLPAYKWMITPSIKIASDQAWLSWDAKSVHYDLRDGYSVMISTTDLSRESFKEVYRVKAEDYFWAHHFVSLKEYQGKNIYVAFVNDSYNKYILAVTNLFIGIPSPGEFEVIDETPRFVGDVTSAAVTGKIRNIGGTVKLNQLECLAKDGQKLTQTYDNLTLEPGETADYEFDLPVSVGNVSGYSLKVTTDAHDAKEILNDSIVCSNYPLTLVAEESTATWCNSCPKGTLYMHLLKKRYKDQIITIVSHSTDPLEFDAYAKGMLRWIVNMPGFIYNRNSSSVFEPTWDLKNDGKLANFILKPVEAKVGMEVNFENQTASNMVQTDATITFATGFDNSTDRYRLGYAVVEKWVNGYVQQNSLSRPQAREFDFLPVHIPEDLTYYHDVARGTANAFTGIENSLPETIEPDTRYEFSHSVEIPETVSNPDNISIVVFVIDTKNKSLLSACEVVNPRLGATDIKETAKNSSSNVVVYQSPDKQTIHVLLPAEIDGTNMYIQLTGLDGRIVYSTHEKATSSISVPSVGLQGCYIINLVSGNQLVSKKIFLK